MNIGNGNIRNSCRFIAFLEHTIVKSYGKTACTGQFVASFSQFRLEVWAQRLLCFDRHLFQEHSNVISQSEISYQKCLMGTTSSSNIIAIIPSNDTIKVFSLISHSIYCVRITQNISYSCYEHFTTIMDFNTTHQHIVSVHTPF